MVRGLTNSSFSHPIRPKEKMSLVSHSHIISVIFINYQYTKVFNSVRHKKIAVLLRVTKLFLDLESTFSKQFEIVIWTRFWDSRNAMNFRMQDS